MQQREEEKNKRNNKASTNSMMQDLEDLLAPSTKSESSPKQAEDKKKDSPNQASPVGKQEKAEVLNSSPIAAGRRAAFIPPPHVLVTRPLTPGTWAPYPQPRQPWPGGRPMGPFPGRGRGQPRYIHPV